MSVSVAPNSYSPTHRAYLEARAVPIELAQQRAARSLSDAEARDQGFRIPQALRAAPSQSLAGLLLPIHRPDGSTFAQLRLDTPIPDPDKPSKLHRFLNLPGQPAKGIDAHPSMLHQLDNPTVPKFLTEGVPKVDAITAAGYCGIGMTGVWMGIVKQDDGSHQLHPDLELVAQPGSIIFMTFDSDQMQNRQVHQALRVTSDLLRARRVFVVYVHVPPTADGHKQGIDDYLAAGGSMAELITNATTTLPRLEGEDRPSCQRDDCRVTREQLRLQTRLLTEPGIRPNRRLPYYALVSRVQSDATRARHPEAKPGKPETWKTEMPLADHDGYIGINLQGMAKDTGISYATLLKARSELIELDVLEAREESSVVPNPKDPDRHIEITRTLVRPAAASPREMVKKLVTVVQAPSGWGGRREWRCPAHSEAKVELKRVCAACGRDAVQVEIAPDPTDFQVENRPGEPSSSLPPGTSSDQLENRPGIAPAVPPTRVMMPGARPPDAEQQRRWQQEAREGIDRLVQQRTATDFQVENRPPEADVGFDPPADGSRSPWLMRFLTHGAQQRWQSQVLCGVRVRQGRKEWERFAQEHADKLPRVVEDLRRLRDAAEGMAW